MMGMDSDQPSACANGTPQECTNLNLSIYYVLISAVSTESPIEAADEANNTQHQSPQEGTTVNIIHTIGHLFVIYSLYIN